MNQLAQWKVGAFDFVTWLEKLTHLKIKKKVERERDKGEKGSRKMEKDHNI